MTIWFDVTTIASCGPPAVGIPRVEMNLAEQLHALDGDVRFCLYEAQVGRFSEVRVDDVRRIVAMHRAPPGSFGPLELQVHRDDRSASGGHGLFARADTWISCGFNWRPGVGNMPHVYALRRAIGLRVVATCHDLIPLLFPHLVPGMAAVFAPYLRDLALEADHVLCDSRCSERDLLRWSKGLGDPAPRTSVMPLGCDAAPGRDTVEVGPRVAEAIGRPFLLSVATIESRKNHQALYRAYVRLVEREVVDLPRLVIVGQLGQGGAAVVDELMGDPRTAVHVTVLSGVSDTELSMLYDRCLFTLFPSLYEGWGLPVSESLAHGKLCLASDQGSLPEAGGAFVDYVDPWNTDAWVAGIRRYLDAPDVLAHREASIREHYRPTSWRESAQHVLGVVAALS